MLSVAVKLLTGTVNEVEFDGIIKEEIIGGIVSPLFIAVVLVSILEVKGSSVKVPKTCLP
jgi:hypothetical protein